MNELHCHVLHPREVLLPWMQQYTAPPPVLAHSHFPPLRLNALNFGHRNFSPSRRHWHLHMSTKTQNQSASWQEPRVLQKCITSCITFGWPAFNAQGFWDLFFTIHVDCSYIVSISNTDLCTPLVPKSSAASPSSCNNRTNLHIVECYKHVSGCTPRTTSMPMGTKATISAAGKLSCAEIAPLRNVMRCEAVGQN